MRLNTNISIHPKKCPAKIWIMHSLWEMVFLEEMAATINCGAVVVEKQASENDR
jgi:hypothetical protein